MHSHFTHRFNRWGFPANQISIICTIPARCRADNTNLILNILGEQIEVC